RSVSGGRVAGAESEAPATLPIVTGWGDRYRVGMAPTEDRRCCRAHNRVGRGVLQTTSRPRSLSGFPTPFLTLSSYRFHGSAAGFQPGSGLGRPRAGAGRPLGKESGENVIPGAGFPP